MMSSRRLSLFLLASVAMLTPSVASAQSWGQARWVWDDPAAHDNEPRYLRIAFDLPGPAAKAELRVTVDNAYTAHVNGHKVGGDADWQSVETFDVAKHLVAGKNVVGIVGRNQGGVAGAIAQLDVKTAAGKPLHFGTDANTRVSRVELPGWLKADFDDRLWPAAAVLGDAGVGPWNLTGGGSPAVQGFNFATVDPKVKDRQKAADQARNFVVPDGFRVELVAADPLVINPVTLAVDERGRLYVSESHTYRYGPPGSPVKPYANPVVRLDPLPDGQGYKRTLIADGFDDPVMGIAVKGDKLWLTANNYLYAYDLPADGPATNKKTLVIDRNKAWNPFGMFVLEWGPDGMLYLSVGNHNIDLQGPGGRLTSRGGSGLIARLHPDGSGMERLVHGLRVPYSFEFDPFGQLWLLSNGEGNPNRFVRVIEGGDYQCYSRPAVDANWLAGNSPLAPPCFELHRGADTQLLRYYGAAYPAAYQGGLLVCNWGGHGFPGLNRGIFRFVPDARNDVTHKEPFVLCSDPYFRPSHVALDADGNLLIADWYGRDDESDMTGRIWRVKYVGPEPTPAMERPGNADHLTGLGSPDHRSRASTADELVRQGNAAVPELAEQAAGAREPLAAAGSLWALARIGTSEAKSALARGVDHPDWRVRRLTAQLLKRYQVASAADVARQLADDPDPAVRVAAALCRSTPEETRSALVSALRHGAAGDAHLRYEAAWHLAKVADAKTLGDLLADADADVRLAGLIAVDAACYEDLPAKKAALASLGQALREPGRLDLDLALEVARLNGDASLVPALEKLVARPDLPAGVIARGLLVLKRSGGAVGAQVEVAAARRFIEAVRTGALKVSGAADQLVLLDFLEAEGPTDFALQQILALARGNQPATRAAALALARRFGAKSAPLADALWPGVFQPKVKIEEAADLLATLALIEASPRPDRWEKVLTEGNPPLRTDAVRWWRVFKGRPEFTDILVRRATELLAADGKLREDLAVVLRHLDVPAETLKRLNLPAPPPADKEALTHYTLEALAKVPADKGKGRAVLGRQVFERAACTKCHTTATQTTLLAPSLKGVGAQKAEYLVESVLFPSKVIKTGFESETVVTQDGRVLSGLVKDEGDTLRVLALDQDVRVPKSAVAERAVTRVSVMPEGQEVTLSRREFADLVAYLATLK